MNGWFNSCLTFHLLIGLNYKHFSKKSLSSGETVKGIGGGYSLLHIWYIVKSYPTKYFINI